jgi:hypothetical protein
MVKKPVSVLGYGSKKSIPIHIKCPMKKTKRMPNDKIQIWHNLFEIGYYDINLASGI